MTARAAIWRTAADLAGQGVAAALATVARRRGSLPMASDAKMIVTPDGRRWGTIGGGCLEADVTGQALEALQAGRPAIVRHTLNADVAGDLGLSCGGTVELFLEPLVGGAKTAALLGRAAAAVERREAGLVATALDWSEGPRKLLQVGAERATLAGWAPAISPAQADRASDGAYLDDALGAFLEPLPRTPRLILFGAGHVGCEIARAAAGTDFHVVVVDDREEFANPTRLPTAEEVLDSDLPGALERLVLDADDYVIACTRGHAMDAVVIERTAASPARYVGMLGSRRKKAVIWNALEQAGVPRAALERVKVPIGDAIGADTPAEIGISVMAELIRLRRLGDQPGEQGAE